MLSLVGEGQFGKVYSAIHRQTGELFALKQLDAQKFSTKKFLRETRILLSLDHENIIRCQGLEHSKKNRFLVTEYCDSGTLRDFIDSSIGLNIEQKLKIIVDILSGLSYVHLKGIIHRDLKPENILLTVSPNGWVAKISDFGVAKIEIEDKGNDIHSLGDTGSPAYMAPEQFYGKYSYSSDIYAVGIILYELLTGKRPFSGSPKEIMIGHLNYSPDIPEHLSPFLQDILKTALAKLPSHRFRTAKEMKGQVLRFLLGLDTKIVDRSPFFDGFLEGENGAFQVDIIDSLDHVFPLFVVSESYFYFAVDNKVVIKQYQVINNQLSIFATKVKFFDGNIIDLQIINDGCFVVVKNTDIYCYFFNVLSEDISLLYSFSANIFISAIAPSCQWLTLGINDNLNKKFQLIKLDDLSCLMPSIEDFFPKEIIIIDQGHGLVIFEQKEVNKNYTFWKFFTRKGAWYNHYCLNLPLENIKINPQHKNYFIAREKFTNHLIIINLKPFTIKRIPLNFYSQFIVAFDNYFICASSQGKILCLDLKGNLVNSFDLQKTIININNLKNKMLIILVLVNNKCQIISLQNVIPYASINSI
ncbi:serine/threonine protein kinase [Cyanobacterium stanieri LEGE 03274]|uniref:Serine/threonine protein kinase n=1 Tax=Cyanobacterium stanieri LEGE 03274 TaxID=1828756 RepID=A0ABR9V6I2_9CHRO|nr:serine/threonine-protein kinase [Cyanobacterium stanieri]MBE9223511.1 serine/threonine protein kinase [Cyanobacterium stanieri LEGE 03274]